MTYNQISKYINIQELAVEKIEKYIFLLTKWNETVNLISKKDLNIIWNRHILDSAQLFSKLSITNEIVDIGSGNGMPAIILAIMGVKKITLIETRQKRCIFLQHIIASLKLNNAFVVNDRVENLTIEADVITTRAFKNLKDTFELCKNIKVKEKFLLLKGARIEGEILEAKKCWSFLYAKTPSIMEENSYILEITNLEKI